MEWYTIPGVSIALVQDGHLVWSNAYGYANTEFKKKLTVDAICRVESISKSVTGWGVMKLVEDELIVLDTPVQQYLENWEWPESEFASSGITIRRLLSNSAGLPLGSLGEEYSPYSERPSLRQYLTREAHLAYEPGAKFEYSNPGFNLLELLIEEVTGRNFTEYMEDEVLLPLGMPNSGFGWNEEWASRIPTGYDLQGKPVPPYVYPYKASGGLFSTIEDIARFAIAEMTPANKRQQNVMSGESIREILTPQIKTSGIFGFVAETYGFGHFIETLPDGKMAVWHGGQGHGWMTHYHAVPETGDAIVIFTNSQRSWPFVARILRDWSHWRGFGPVKFSRITTAVAGLQIIVGLIFLITVWRGVHVIHGVITGRRKPAISQKRATKPQITEFVLGILIAGVLLWAVTRNYLFLTSIFPIGAAWLGWTLLLLALVLWASALLPVAGTGTYANINHELP